MDALAQRSRLVVIQRPVQRDGVLALDPEPRMQDVVRPRSIVGQQDQPLRVEIQPPDRVEAGAVRHQSRRDEIQDRGLGVPIAGRGGYPGRLVQRNVGPGCSDANGDAVHLDPGGRGVHLFAERHNPSVDAGPPFLIGLRSPVGYAGAARPSAVARQASMPRLLRP